MNPGRTVDLERSMTSVPDGAFPPGVTDTILSPSIMMSAFSIGLSLLPSISFPARMATRCAVWAAASRGMARQNRIAARIRRIGNSSQGGKAYQRRRNSSRLLVLLREPLRRPAKNQSRHRQARELRLTSPAWGREDRQSLIAALQIDTRT